MHELHYQELVCAVARAIPAGRVTTYGAIAQFLALGSARMVGWALHQNRCHAPAHRVVNRKGELSGRIHFHTPTMMEELLRAEGVEVVQQQVVHFSTLFWDPAVALGDDWEPA